MKPNVCEKTGWQVLAYRLLQNHFHISRIVEKSNGRGGCPQRIVRPSRHNNRKRSATPARMRIGATILSRVRYFSQPASSNQPLTRRGSGKRPKPTARK